MLCNEPCIVERDVARHVSTLAFLPLRELEAFSRALLSVLFALFAARITGDHALRLELLTQLDIEQHEGTGDAEANCISLASHSSARDIGQHIKARGRLCKGKWRLGTRSLGRRHEVLFERFAVNLEFPAAGTKKYTRDRRLAAARSVVLNCLCHC